MMFSCSQCSRVLRCVLACFSLLIANTALAGTTVPAPWIAADVGSPALTGSTTYGNGTFTVSAGGAGITGRSDQFHFVYQALTGDATIFARVDTLASVDANSRVGLMIRSALSANAVNAFAYVSAANVGLSRRTAVGGRTTTTTWSSGSAPVWLALKREGATLTGYASTDGSTWRTILATTVSMNQTIYVGIAASASSSTQRALATVSGVVFGNSLPDGQQAADLGSPTPAGSTSYSAGTYIVRAGGLDIGGTSDQFHFVYRQVSGDVDVVARVAAVTAADPASRAGIMVRASLSPSAAFAYSALSASAGHGFEWRYTSGASASVTNGGAGAPPGWVRLTRSGGQFNAYRSADGQKWTLVESMNVAMPTTVYVGLAVTSRRSGTATTATVDNLRVTAGASTTNGAPTVTLTAPTAGQSWTAPASIALAADASDPENRLSRVEFYANGSFIGSDTAAPFGMTWSNVPAGTYAVTARAFDADGGQAESASASVAVTSPNSPPTVSLTSPASGQLFTVGASVTLAATASDPEGRMSRVEFFVNNTFLAADASAPYSALWAPTSAGTYSLTAVAFDADGGRTASSAAAVTVSAPVTTPPRYVAFTASSDHATTVVTGYRLNVYAAGADATTATPVATSDLGKPTPDAQQVITVERGSFFTALASGSYLGTVSAYGPGGSAQSLPPVSFTR